MAKKTATKEKGAKKGKKLTVDDLKKVGGANREEELDGARKLADPMVKANKGRG